MNISMEFQYLFNVIHIYLKCFDKIHIYNDNLRFDTILKSTL